MEHRNYIPVTVDTIKTLRKTLQIGDVVDYDTYQYSPEDERLVVPVKVPVVITEKYPHLVRVRRRNGRDDGRVRTLTYVEIALQRMEGKAHV